MVARKKESTDELKSTIRILIIQEVRLLGLERNRGPSFMRDEMGRSIQEAKKQVMTSLRLVDRKERDLLVRRAILQSVDEEIEWVTQARRNKCLRCIHVRYFDASGASHVKLPIGESQAETIGCDLSPQSRGNPCQRFAETTRAVSLRNYLDEMTFLYELREMFEEIEKIWEDYLTR
jgi:hypothetical protein